MTDILFSIFQLKHIYIIYILLAALSLGACSSKKSTLTHPQQNVVKVVPSSDKQVNELIRQARSWIGTPYAYGGHTRKKGTDCSGMIMELFLSVYDLKLPRSSAMQQEFSRPVNLKDIQPGDLIFFATANNSSRVNHVGLYIGNNRMIHASGSRGVMESSISEKYWQNTYHSSGAVIETNKRAKKNRPMQDTMPAATFNKTQELYNSLDAQIDSIYVNDPAIFD